MGDIRFGAPSDLILDLKDAFGIPTFVETGTFQGDTAFWASGHFERVITIEKSEPLYRAVLKRYGDVGNLSLLFGDSRERLKEILPELPSPTLFWLDAHLCGGQTYGQGDECPLLGEISAIMASGIEAFVLIDDARLFLSPPPPGLSVESWPDLLSVSRCLSGRASGGYLAVFEDVILWTPGRARQRVVAFLREAAARDQQQREARRSNAGGRFLNRLARRLWAAKASSDNN